MPFIKKSILASLLIGFGVTVLLTLGKPLGAIFFSFGLLSVCCLQANLFTGKAGYYWRNNKIELSKILFINLISGYIIGRFIGFSCPQLMLAADDLIYSWEFSLPFFIKSCFCGMIMYICVNLFNS